MSWNIFIPDGTKDDVKQKLADQEFNYDPKSYAYKEMRAQFDVAREAALALLDSDTVGREGARYAVSLGGHGNPDHIPAQGWAPEMLHITITEMRLPTEDEKQAP